MATRLDQEIEQPEKIVEQGLDFCKVVAMRLDRQIEQLENIVEQQLEVRGITRPVGGTGPEAARGTGISGQGHSATVYPALVAGSTTPQSLWFVRSAVVTIAFRQ